MQSISNLKVEQEKKIYFYHFQMASKRWDINVNVGFDFYTFPTAIISALRIGTEKSTIGSLRSRIVRSAIAISVSLAATSATEKLSKM